LTYSIGNLPARHSILYFSQVISVFVHSGGIVLKKRRKRTYD
jgi:hypothetical protein